MKRLNSEYKIIRKSTVSNIIVRPDIENALEWYFIFHSMDKPYDGGVYFGKLKFTANYPFEAPTIEFITPSGRFTPNMKICTSFSHFHPETWSTSWTIESMLIGLLSFMYEESAESIGGIIATTKVRQEYAKISLEYNKKYKKFNELFPEFK
jgi:ubiquitin-conjugating enzyme E2 J2